MMTEERRLSFHRALRQPAPQGCFRRRLLLTATAGRVEAAVEDDFHHFRVALQHAQGRVTSVTATAPRSPWSTCADAAAMLKTLVGLPVSPHPWIETQQLDPRLQCTHQYDLALLAMATAAHGTARCYDATITDPVAGRRQALLQRDGATLLQWMLQDFTIQAPDALAGRTLQSLGARALTGFGDEFAEQVLVLRRAVMTSQGRMLDLDRLDTAEDTLAGMQGACYTYRIERAAQALRNRGSSRDLTHADPATLALHH